MLFWLAKAVWTVFISRGELGLKDSKFTFQWVTSKGRKSSLSGCFKLSNAISVKLYITAPGMLGPSAKNFCRTPLFHCATEWRAMTPSFHVYCKPCQETGVLCPGRGEMDAGLKHLTATTSYTELYAHTCSDIARLELLYFELIVSQCLLK